MNIYITSGIGEGPTPLAAFDSALINAGIANYNLIRLSSVIPVGSIIERTRFNAPQDDYGHRLYIVMAQYYQLCPGESAWAGLGWTQDEDDGRGLFVEGGGSERAALEEEIFTTLKSMEASRHPYGAIHSEIVGTKCYKRPVCAVVAAIYESEGWKTQPRAREG